MSLRDALRREALDPLPRRYGRIARLFFQRGFASGMKPTALPGMAVILGREGVGARTIHAVHAAHHPERPAIVDVHRTWTYRRLNNDINRLANALHDQLGVRRRTPVCVMLENRGEYVVTWFALFRLGAATVHAGYRLTVDELRYQIEHSGAQIALASAATIESMRRVRAALAAEGKPLRILVTGDVTPADDELSWDGLVNDGAAAWPPNTAREAVSENIVYTSGTTGKPKGAVRDFTAVGPTDLFRLLERMPLHAGERHMIVSPLYHSAGQAFTLLGTAIGATLYLRPGFEPADTLEHLSRWGIHSIFMVPTMLRRVLDLPEPVKQRWPLSELRAIISGAAEFPHELRLRAIAAFGPETIHDFYGATELGWVTMLNGHEMQARPSSVGRALPGQEIRITDEARQPRPVGEIGTVWIRNEQTMLGYLHDDAATEESTHEGWLTCDDLGRLDADGYLYLAGRSRDMVISGGVNIYPVEIEEALLEHPAIREVAVIGLPDPEWGERLCAVVVPADATAPFPAADVEAWGRERLAGYKIPRTWQLVDELPRNMTGKVLKRALREQFGKVAEI
jgi:fatty-acyl-CoA synthase